MIGHSRLLKFLAKDKPEMEKHTLKIEDFSPSDIESEVPRQQNLREATTEPKHDPVQNETIEWTDLRDMIKNPVYMGLQEEVIRTQLIRAPRVSDEAPKDETGISTSRLQEGARSEAEKVMPEDNKPKTRIPVARFKPAAERVTRERRESEAQKSKIEAPVKPRRTSIPKPTDKMPILKKNPATDDSRTVIIESEHVTESKVETPVKTVEGRAIGREQISALRKDQSQITKKDVTPENGDKTKNSSNDQLLNNIHNDLIKTDVKLDEEFDKLYEEIVDIDVASLPDEILETKVKDPEKLDNKFEEIVHQYDDINVEQVTIEPVDKARYSRIPLLRRRSSHDVKVPRQSERRMSLKTGKINKAVEAKNQDINHRIKEKDDNHENCTKEDTIHSAPDDIDNVNNENHDIGAESLGPLPDYNTIPAPDSELVKVGIFGTSNHDISLEETSPTTFVATPEKETVKVGVLNTPAKDAPIDIIKDLETGEINTEYINESPEDSVKVEDEPGVITDNENKDIEIINKMEEDSVNDDNDRKETINNEDNYYEETQKNKSQLDILVRNPDDELKSFGLLKNTNTIEERTKSRYVIKPQKEKVNSNNIAAAEEPIVKGKVSRILKSLTSQKHSSNSVGKEEIDVQKNVDSTSIPKKKSVLSKIAIFERADPVPSFPENPIHNYSKPKRTISEEIKHSPKIVQEVLKTKDAEPADNHIVVTIDIMKPVEIITNNEEQVTFVENLTEDAVTYDNFDNSRLNRTEPIEYEPKSKSIMDQNKTDSTKLNTYDDEIEIKDVSQETNKGHKTENELKSNEYYNERNDVETNKKEVVQREADILESREALADFVPVKEKINRLTSYDETNLKKAKSTAELDLGDAVKGKVKNIIVRINSFEQLDDVKPKEVEIISVKERPRKRSVSEKIALFERKLTPATETVQIDIGRALKIDRKPVKDTVNSIPTTEEYATRVKELVNAKITYGSVNVSCMELRGGSMPVLALGTALLDPRLAKHIVAAAIDLGYRAIDTAFIYGNEREVGEGIRAKIQDGTVRREDLFITSKLWSTFHRPDLVEPACRASLAATGLEYFDLFVIHNPMSLKEGGDPLPKIANVLQFSEYDYLDAWFAMEQLVPKHLVKSIGLSNFNSAQVARVMEKGRIKPVANQVECHPYLSQQRLSDFCEARGVHLSCFGVLGSKGTPADLKASQAAAIDDPLVQVMAAGLGISPAQLLIKYQFDSGRSVVVKASSAAHLWNNLQALNVKLEPAQIAALHALNKNRRTFTFKGMGDTHRNYPFKIPF